MSKDVKKGINGKNYVAALDSCVTPKGIFELLGQTMDNETLRTRLKNVTNDDLIVALHAQVARFNAGQGFRTSHQDCVEMAADRHHQLTQKGVKYFKADLNKYITSKEKEGTSKELISPLIANRNKMER